MEFLSRITILRTLHETPPLQHPDALLLPWQSPVHPVEACSIQAQDLGFRVQGFGVQGLGFRVQGLGTHLSLRV